MWNIIIVIFKLRWKNQESQNFGCKINELFFWSLSILIPFLSDVHLENFEYPARYLFHNCIIFIKSSEMILKSLCFISTGLMKSRLKILLFRSFNVLAHFSFIFVSCPNKCNFWSPSLSHVLLWNVVSANWKIRKKNHRSFFDGLFL